MVVHKIKVVLNPKIENAPSEIKFENPLHSTKLEDSSDPKIDSQKEVEPISIGEFLK